MAGLSEAQLIEILDTINRTDQVRKRDLHEAIASAIVENNRKVVQDIVEKNQMITDELIRQHVDEYHR